MASVRYFLKLSYAGTGFHGWQIQPNSVSIQEELSFKLSVALQSEISLMGCGRTDTGVHAKEFYAHFDLPEPISMKASDLVYKLNLMLPEGIAVQDLIPVKADAHARFDAVRRSYQYVIVTTKDVFRTEFSYRLIAELDVEAMNKACKLLLGEHDFSCFCKNRSTYKTTNCTILQAQWTRNEHLLLFDITANRFLRNMVRAIVGTMLNVGKGKTSLQDFKDILASKSRKRAGKSVPPQGLYLTSVEYPPEIFSPTP